MTTPKSIMLQNLTHGHRSLTSGDLYGFGLKHCALNCAVVGSRLSRMSVTVPLRAVAKDPEGHSPPQALPARVDSPENKPLLVYAQRVTRKAAVASAPASAGEKFSNRFGVCWIPGGSSLLNHPRSQSKVGVRAQDGPISSSSE